MTAQNELLTIIKNQSYEKREVTLTSGKTSDFYIDCKMTTTDPRGACLTGRMIFEKIKSLKVDGVGGMSMGADPVATAVAMTSSAEGTPVKAFFVRKERKKHGKQAWIEGGFGLKKGSRVVIVEDVVTTGGSTLRSVERAQSAGFIVEKIIAVVDREEGGTENIKKSGIAYEALFKKSDIVTLRLE